MKNSSSGLRLNLYTKLPGNEILEPGVLCTLQSALKGIPALDAFLALSQSLLPSRTAAEGNHRLDLSFVLSAPAEPSNERLVQERVAEQISQWQKPESWHKDDNNPDLDELFA